MLASGGDDNSLKLWFWLIVGVIFLIKKVIELLKPDEKDEEPPVPNTEDHHEKRVKEVIAEMRRTKPQPRQIQPNQSAAPSRAPRPSAPSVELPSPAVTRKTDPDARSRATCGSCPADGAKCTGTLCESYGRSPTVHPLPFRCGTGSSATFAKERDEGTSAWFSSVISHSGISFPEKFPAPPQLPESGCSLSGNPWETQSLTKRFLQRRIKHGLSSRIMFLQPSCCPLLFILPCLKR